MKHALLCLVLFAGPLFGQEITVPEKLDARTGRLNAVVVKSSLKMSWLIIPEVEAFREHDPDQGTIRLRFIPPRDGQYVLVCAGISGEKIVQVACVITSGGGNSLQAVAQAQPADRLGFASIIKAELDKIPAEPRKLAPKLADNFEAIAAKAAATTNMTIAQMQADLDVRNAEVITGPLHVNAWRPFFAAWKGRSEELISQGRLVTADQWAVAYQETAVGLRK